jgi:hypothetical protein
VTPDQVAVPTPPPAPTSPVGPSMAAFGGNESCPNCGARMAADQRYCLNCGHRRGDPRLPFMDAVVFMESMNAPGGAGGATPPPPPAQSGDGNNRWNANAALIAGVATLVLAIGVGFLIGRSGHDNSTQAAAPQVIKVEGGGGPATSGTEESTEATTSEESGGKEEAGGKAKGGKSGGKSAIKTENTGKATKKAEENVKEGTNGQAESVEKVLHSTVPQAQSEAKVGDACEEGTAGCEGKEFTGNFFGE